MTTIGPKPPQESYIYHKTTAEIRLPKKGEKPASALKALKPLEPEIHPHSAQRVDAHSLPESSSTKKTHSIGVTFLKAMAKPFTEAIAFIKAMHHKHVVIPKQKAKVETKTRALELLGAEFGGNTKKFTPEDKKILKNYLSSDNHDAGIAILREFTKPPSKELTKSPPQNLEDHLKDLFDIVFTSLTKEECLDLTKDAMIAQLPLEKLDTLFRDTSMATRLMAALHKKLIPNPKRLLQGITIKKYDLKNKNNEIRLKGQIRLQKDCSKILQRLVDLTNNPKFPKEIKEFTTAWQKAVVDKAIQTGDDVDAASLTSQPFMLRFFNPIIFQLAADNGKPEKKEAYTNLATALQTITNRSKIPQEEHLKFVVDAINQRHNVLLSRMNELSSGLTSSPSRMNELSSGLTSSPFVNKYKLIIDKKSKIERSKFKGEKLKTQKFTEIKLKTEEFRNLAEISMKKYKQCSTREEKMKALRDWGLEIKKTIMTNPETGEIDEESAKKADPDTLTATFIASLVAANSLSLIQDINDFTPEILELEFVEIEANVPVMWSITQFGWAINAMDNDINK